MRGKSSSILVGAFTIGGVLLGAALLLAAGAFDPFHDHVRVAVMFDESVSGLEQGSPVKLRGAHIGRVSSLNVACSMEERALAVIVVCEVQADAISDGQGAVIELSEGTRLQSLVERGLRATLGIEGITGMRFVSLDFYDPQERPPDLPRWVEQADLVVVPAVPSPLTEITESLSQMLKGVGDLEIGGAIGDLRAVLQALEPQIREADFGKLVASAQRAAESLDRALAQGEGAMELLRRVVDPQRGLGAEAARALESVGAAAGAVRRLAEFLERNPSALLAGRELPRSR